MNKKWPFSWENRLLPLLLDQGEYTYYTILLDKDACAISNPCNVAFADCFNNLGVANCICKRGYSGNGTYCESESSIILLFMSIILMII